MILAFDTHYRDHQAKTVCIAFKAWPDEIPYEIFNEITENKEPYRAGEFYRRELPCILSLLNKISYDYIAAIIVDGFVYLDDHGKAGLGAHLYHSLNEKIPIIGVAKSNFMTLVKEKRIVLRGKSERPLYVTAVGIDVSLAAEHIKSMAGEHRIPSLFKTLDTLTKCSDRVK